MEPRGSRRLPSVTYVDFELKKAWDVGSDGKVQLIGSVNNLFNENEITGVNTSVSTIAFGLPTSYQRPRSYEFGFRFTWR